MILRLTGFTACAALVCSAGAFGQDASTDPETVERRCEVKKIMNDDGTVETILEGDCEDVDLDKENVFEFDPASLPEGAKRCRVKETKHDDGTVERTEEGDCEETSDLAEEGAVGDDN